MYDPQLTWWWDEHGRFRADQWFAALDGGPITQDMASTLPPARVGLHDEIDWLKVIEEGFKPDDATPAIYTMSPEFAEFIGGRRDEAQSG
jgi:hypothetical protein